MVVKSYNVGVVEAFHDFEFAIFILFVLVDMLDGDFFAIEVQVFGLST